MIDIKKKAVICIAAGKSQMLVIEKAKRMGYSVIGIDRDPNAVGFQFCDECINLSTHESLPIVERLKELQKKYEFKGVLNRSFGIPVITSAEICKAFQLPGISPEAAEIVIDKSKLISFCNKNDISAPFNLRAESFQNIQERFIRFPLVVKPALPFSGKCGVVKVDEKREIKSAFNRAQKASISGVVNIEEYIEGHDVTLMSIVKDGRVYLLTLLDEITDMNEKGEFYGVGFAVPSIFSSTNVETDILSLANQIVSKLGLNTTIFLMSCRCEFGKLPKLIEIHLDFGGDLVLDNLIPESSDYDVLGSFIDALVGNVIEVPEHNFRPTAIIYGGKSASVSDNQFNLIQADTRDELNRELGSIEET